MPDEQLRAAFEKLRARVPESVADAATLRADVRAVDRALGELIRSKKAALTDAEQGQP